MDAVTGSVLGRLGSIGLALTAPLFADAVENVSPVALISTGQISLGEAVLSPADRCLIVQVPVLAENRPTLVAVGSPALGGQVTSVAAGFAPIREGNIVLDVIKVVRGHVKTLSFVFGAS